MSCIPSAPNDSHQPQVKKPKLEKKQGAKENLTKVSLPLVSTPPAVPQCRSVWVGMDLSPNSPGIACLNATRNTLSFLYLDQQWKGKTFQPTKRVEIKLPEPFLIETIPVGIIEFHQVGSEPRGDSSREEKRKGKRKRDENEEAMRLVRETDRLMTALGQCADFDHPQDISVLIESYTYHQTASSARQDLIHHHGGAFRM
jgi:hypothetical protein